MLEAFRKRICLVKEFFLLNPFIGVFWGILQVLQDLPRKTPLIFFFFFFIILSICCFYLVVYQITKPPWNCVSASRICWSGCCSQPVFVIVSMTQYVENFNLQILHYHICRGSLKNQSHPLRLYFRNGQSSPYNFPFTNLVSKTVVINRPTWRTSYRSHGKKKDSFPYTRFWTYIYN